MKLKNLFGMMVCMLLLLITTSYTADAQQLSSKKPTADTLVDVDAATIVSDAIGDVKKIAIQVTAKKISGTLAGKVYLQASLNGVDYLTLDSLTLTNSARVSKIFTITGTPAQYYQAAFTSTGTVRYLPELYVLFRKE